jgi:enoyl-CoA hydratase
LLAGNDKGFCGGYDLVESAEGSGAKAKEGGATSDGAGTAPPAGSPLDPAVIAANHNPGRHVGRDGGLLQ